MARLAPEKRVDWVLRAFDAAAARHPGWELEVVGDGPERAALERLTAGLEHGQRIRFRGEVPTADLAEVYDAAGVLALASAFEGTPMVLAEAMARGVPVVCTPSSEAVAATARAAGFLSEDSPGAFTRTLADAMGQEETAWRELSAAALEQAHTHDPQAVVEHWLRLLRR
ncbi:GDP-mannose-dependent alpha-(1-6)-phosphatidylinositol monomannoside mannosyltransferase [Rothia kristinae]|nr:GDP-mannose-dependent alpha-(1-6)-phosphatidylinositol monomannoside mannosyltransferase [Rothia kristinae]